MNLLIFPGGTEIGLEIHRSLINTKGLNIFSASSDVSNHAPYIYKQHMTISDIYSKKCLNELKSIICENKINLIYPGNDLVIDFLSKHINDIDCEVIIPDINIVRLLRSKKNTLKYFKQKLPVPEVYKTINVISDFPVFIKPDRGYGSQGVKKITNKSELNNSIKKIDEIVIQEYLPGREYTIDCFSSKDKGLLFCSGRERKRIRMGTSMNSCEVDSSLNNKFYEYAKVINQNLIMSGAWFFQMKEDKYGKLKLLEIAPRIAGTMAMNRVRGINFSLLSIYEKLNIKYEVNINSYKVEIDRSLTNRYQTNIDYNTVYIDLDDTIILKGYINTSLMQFLYQCINNKKEIILLTKSLTENIEEELKKYKIKEIFDEIIWINETEKKEDYIDITKKPIFIDDSFSQRKNVSDKLNIYTFDPSFIEILIDHRR